jgi:4-diphosphocytidyl-2-C-methyl-D-erythritol kinase
MAGGSADAAAALRLLGRAAGVRDVGVLREIAAGLGADVPAQVLPGRYLATGAGERVEALAPSGPR